MEGQTDLEERHRDRVGDNSVGRSYVEEALRWGAPVTEGGEEQVEGRSPSVKSEDGLSGIYGRVPVVLFADDNADCREYVSGMLKRVCAVRVVGDGVEAWKSVEEDAPDLIIRYVSQGFFGF